MDTNKIRELLKRYEDGDSNPVEERQLEEYFLSGNDIPAAWEHYRQIFEWRARSREQRLTTGFRNNLKERLQSTPDEEQKNFIRMWQRPLRIAASLLLLIASGWILFVELRPTSPSPSLAHQEETFDDPELAYQQTMEALAFLSNKWNKGHRKASGSLEKLRSIDQVIPN